MKVVINKCYGGFSISLEAARFMAERGNKSAVIEVAEYDQKVADPSSQNAHERRFGVRFYGYGYTENCEGYDRADPALVEAVETLGDAANGEHAKLRVIEIPDGTTYEIDDYDGMERIAETHRTWG